MSFDLTDFDPTTGTMTYRVPAAGPPAWARAPQVSVEFPQNSETGVPTVNDEVTVRVDVDPSDRETPNRSPAANLARRDADWR